MGIYLAHPFGREELEVDGEFGGVEIELDEGGDLSRLCLKDRVDAVGVFVDFQAADEEGPHFFPEDRGGGHGFGAVVVGELLALGGEGGAFPFGRAAGGVVTQRAEGGDQVDWLDGELLQLGVAQGGEQFLAES